ncbi:MAG TPA: hypothetical protein VMJ64_06365 [Anaerolineales bacterium]|nr:hypothetical protein [Anaerolineales bacterium]
MKRSVPQILIIIVILLGVTLTGFARALAVPTGSAASIVEPPPIGQVLESATATVTSLPLPTPFNQVPTEIPNASVFAFIQAPQGPLQLPYVTLYGFQIGTFLSGITINGTMNSTEFECPGSPCTVPLQLGETRFIFKAQTPSGAASDVVYATVEAEMRSDGYYVTITSVSQFARGGSDACLPIWEITDDQHPAWAQFPLFPFELNTNIPLHHLAARLITYGEVDTKDCPAGGLSQDMDWPNGCGLQKATPKMIQWENQFDDAIWTAANQIGIPPKIMKTLIEVESQFWPGNERYYVDEYGLGQVNQLGVDVLLRNDYNLYQQVCATVLPNCITPYISLPPAQQALVRGALLASQNTTCTNCTYGVDITRAKQSISFLAQVLRANCQQTKDVMKARGLTTDYESYWKFTLLNYHSGQTCLAQAVQTTKSIGDPMDWEHLAPQVACAGGRKYVDGFWANLSLFDSYKYVSGAQPSIQYQPVLQPTHTPQPSPTPIISSAQVVVTVYIDTNGDGTPGPGDQLLSGIPVQLILPEGKVLSATTSNGQAQFDLSGYVTGIQITATLPGLYRSYQFYLPQTGTVSIPFIFAEPTLPGKLP